MLYLNLKGLITRKGLLKWPVCEAKSQKNMEEEKKSDDEKNNPNNFFNIYESFDQLPKDYNGQVRATMFPDTIEKMRDVYKIQNTVRLMPHDQNTGGFYLALIRKKNHVVFGGGKATTTETKVPKKDEPVKEQTMNVEVQENQEEEAIKDLAKEVDEKEALKLANETVAEEESKVEEGKGNKETKETMQEEQNFPKEKEKKKKEKKETFVTLDAKDWESIRDYYGLDERLRDLLIQQSPGEKKVYLISPGIRKILDLDKSKGIHSYSMKSVIIRSCNKAERRSESLF